MPVAIEKAREGITKGKCEICGCTALTPCVTEYGPCAWTDESETLCDSGACLAKASSRMVAVVKTVDQLADWIEMSARLTGDPSELICQAFCRWRDEPNMLSTEDLECGYVDRQLGLKLGPGAFLPMSIAEWPKIGNAQAQGYGALEIADGVWGLFPSLHVPGLVHAFVTVHGVPSPAPWQGPRIIMAR